MAWGKVIVAPLVRKAKSCEPDKPSPAMFLTLHAGKSAYNRRARLTLQRDRSSRVFCAGVSKAIGDILIGTLS